jgi:hypothetical protein
MTGTTYDDFRPYIAERYADQGAKLTDAEWESICQNVAKAPPLTDEILSCITDLLVPVSPSVLAPAVDDPSAHGGPPPARPRRQRPVRAA